MAGAVVVVPVVVVVVAVDAVVVGVAVVVGAVVVAPVAVVGAVVALPVVVVPLVVVPVAVVVVPGGSTADEVEEIVLLPSSGSGVEAVACAAAKSAPAELGRTVTVTVTLAPGGSAPSSQRKLPVGGSQTPTVAAAAFGSENTGTIPLTTTSAAAPGPPLRTVKSRVRIEPTRTGVGKTACASVRSATPVATGVDVVVEVVEVVGVVDVLAVVAVAAPPVVVVRVVPVRGGT